MEIITIASYALTLLAVFFAVTSIPQMLLGGLIGQLVGPLASALLGGIVSWAAIDALWYFLEGGHIPFTVLVGSFLLLVMHGITSKEELTEQANWTMAGEMWAIIVVGICIFLLTDQYRWY